MLFIVQGFDKPGTSELRLANYDSHKKHVSRASEYGVHLVMGGPLVDEENDENMIGSFLLVETESKSNLERFIQEDPFRRADVWEDIIIARFHRRFG